MAHDQRLTIRVPDQAAGSRLDQFLADPLGSRAQAQRAIELGGVTVDGRSRPKRHSLQGGELITVDRSDRAPLEPDPSPAPFRIAHEDPHLLVIDKPAGVVVHPGKGNRTGTLAQALAGVAAGGEEPWRAGIVHRLDRDTSGLLVVAKSEAVHRKLKAELAARRLHREYLTLVDGHPDARSGTIEAPIGRDRRDPTRVSMDTETPRDARTHFKIERLLPEAALFRVTLETGRTHQIRVHMAAIGHPVLGDRQYGGRMAYGLERQFLHAARLAFKHPATDEQVDVTSPLPGDLTAALEQASQSA